MARPKPCAPPVTTAQRPFRSILFMSKVLSRESCASVVYSLGPLRGARLKSQRPAAVDEMRDTGGERALVAGEVDGERSDFLSGAEPSHRLPRDEHVASAGAGR